MKAIRKLTGMGGDVRQIAKLLQAKAPPGHKLAYINDEEAALLKSRGGSGRITESGIPSFDQTYYSDPTSLQGQQAVSDITPAPAEAPATAPASDSSLYSLSSGISANPPASSESVRLPDYNQSLALPQPGQAPALGALPSPPFDANAPYIAPQYDFTAPKVAMDVGGAAIAPTPDKTFTQKTLDYLGQPKTLAALGIGGVQAALGASSVRKAQAEAQAAKEQLQALAAPYQQQGQQLQQYAQQGQLTPANQQVLQAAQAQLAQGAAARGGVGVAQATNQIATLTNQLLANQMNMGIQLQGVGDKIAQGAIQTGIQADQYINNLTSNYAQNIARTVAGAAGIQQTPTYVQAQP